METVKTFATKPKNDIINRRNVEFIPNLVFNLLVNALQCDSDDLDGAVGFAASHEDWALSFYAEADEFFKMKIEDFGFFVSDASVRSGKRWVQCLPTSEQLSKLNGILDSKIKELEQEREHEIQARREAESYDVRAEQGLFTYAY